MSSKTITVDNSPQLSGDDAKRYPPSGVSVLIVGAGLGGLFAALECWRKGHEVRIIDRLPVASAAGMLINAC